jgi:hypothetical protein
VTKTLDVLQMFQTSNEVLDAMQIIHSKCVNLPPPDHLADKIFENEKFFPYFKDCIGALDGTHIPVFVRALSAPAFGNRKGFLTQNVLGVCTFNLPFCHVYAGWEASANDQAVLNDAMRRAVFQVPAGKFYLGDAGYVNSDTIESYLYWAHSWGTAVNLEKLDAY